MKPQKQSNVCWLLTARAVRAPVFPDGLSRSDTDAQLDRCVHGTSSVSRLPCHASLRTCPALPWRYVPLCNFGPGRLKAPAIFSLQGPRQTIGPQKQAQTRQACQQASRTRRTRYKPLSNALGELAPQLAQELAEFMFGRGIVSGFLEVT
ncbi:hypothetical protein GQ53DRAFT_308443 [Thozetella sp. PMI_491]|nr:hypothetical protein GQ53DRAFT_308443 [Thozetella sp. PMI_491]